MNGTATYTRNVFHRIGDAYHAWKAAPTPGDLYPPAQSVQTGFLTFPGWNYLDNNTSGNAKDEDNARMAAKNPWVYRNCNAIANEVSTAELVMKRRVGEDEEDEDNHPFEQLWESPNPHMGRGFLMQFWAWQLLLFGEAYLYFLPAGGTVQEIWPIPSYMMTPIPDVQDFIKLYAFQAAPATKPILIESKYICYSRLANPFDIRRGMSPLVACMVDLLGDNAMARWNANFFSKENAAPTGIMAVPRDTLDTDIQRIRLEMQDFFGGSQRRVAVARAGDLAWTAIDRSQKDMEFLAGREFTSKIIDTVFGIPEGYWSKDATRANSEGAKATMIENAVWPKLELLREDMNAQIVPIWVGDDFRASFADIRPRNRALELQEFTAYQAVLTVDELRALIDKEELGDPRGLMLVAEIAKGTPLPATPASDATEEAISAMEDEAAAEAPADDEALPPDEGDVALDEETPPEEMGGTVPEEMKALDLRRWETKALKALKRSSRAAVRFESSVIPQEEYERISVALVSAQTASDVRAAFKATDEPDDLDAEWAAAMDWAKKASRGD